MIVLCLFIQRIYIIVVGCRTINIHFSFLFISLSIGWRQMPSLTFILYCIAILHRNSWIEIYSSFFALSCGPFHSSFPGSIRSSTYCVPAYLFFRHLYMDTHQVHDVQRFQWRQHSGYEKVVSSKLPWWTLRNPAPDESTFTQWKAIAIERRRLRTVCVRLRINKFIHENADQQTLNDVCIRLFKTPWSTGSKARTSLAALSRYDHALYKQRFEDHFLSKVVITMFWWIDGTSFLFQQYH